MIGPDRQHGEASPARDLRLIRRRLPLGGAAALCAPSPPLLARPRSPDRPIRLVVPFAAGGGVDIVARLLAEPMVRPLAEQGAQTSPMASDDVRAFVAAQTEKLGRLVRDAGIRPEK